MNRWNILDDFNVPEMRKGVNESNARWLCRNFAIHNSEHSDFKKVVEELNANFKLHGWDTKIMLFT